MAIDGALPPASIYSTWFEQCEVWDIDTDTPFDLSDMTDIILKVRDLKTGFDELVISLSAGDITVPDLGIVQWRVPPGTMGTLSSKLYEAIMLFEDGTDTFTLFLGNISIVE